MPRSDFSLHPPDGPDPHYPSIKPALVELTTALNGLAHDEHGRGEYLADAAAYAGGFRLTPPQRTALLGLDTRALVKMGVHPLVAFLANMQVQRQRKS
jgi:2,3-dihydroxyphenylpropionate 1,2-dioxygenase